jgi:trimeric autotransporter adhesin
MKSIKYILFLLLISNSILGQPACPITTNNIRVCPNTNAQLNVSGAQFYSWTPSAGLSDSTSANPTVNVPITTNYFVTGFNESSTNLIVNGDFSSGNSGFTSNYTYTTTDLHPEGYYAVGKNPKSLHSDFSACGDHTTGTGKMLIVNGNVVPNIKVWGQPITVKANTYYAFYAYVTPVHPINPPVLQFSINGSVIGAPFTSSNVTCTWQKFYAVWYSGSITNANISIVNQNTIANGNDFALDDIKFVELCTATNKVTVTVGPLTSTTNISTCTTNLPYNWNGSAYNASGTYTKHLASVVGCDSIATLNLTVNVPTTSTTNTSVCQGGSYLFNGTSYNITGTYSKTLINAVGCDSVATLNLTVNVPTTSTTNASICQGSSYTFNGSTYNVAGTYSKTLINAVGCDSIATLNLIVNVPTTSTTNGSICQGGSYSFNGTSYNTTGTYSKTLINAVGCDSIATLNLTVNVPTASNTNASICQGSSYTFNGSTYYVAGTYTKTLINAAGCDSIATLNLKVNVPTTSTTNAGICQGSLYTFNGSTYNVAGAYSKTLINAAGCDSIATLNLTVNVPTSSVTNASICQGSSYTFNGSIYNVAGIYSKTLINAVGCDSIATLNLKVNLPTASTTNASICQGGSYLFNGISYSTAGTYSKILINSAGCDSIATLNLKVNVPTTSTTNASICQGSSYLFNGTIYNTTGTYSKTLTNAAGCDSIATLNLTVNVPTASTTNASICQGSSYIFNGSTYNVAGTYSKTLINAAGCDSIATLNLTVNVSTVSTTNASICQGGSYLFNGTSYNATGTYSKILINAAGCDSIATLNLTVNVPTTSTTNVSICRGSSYTFNGSTYNVAGTYSKTLINSAGCDSIATLNLTVNVPTSSTTNASVCQGGSFLFNGTRYNTTGTYSKTLLNAAGCDSIVTLNLMVNVPTSSTTNASICQGSSYTFNGSTYNVAGTYSKTLINAVGCDSIATLNLTVNAPTSSTTNAGICLGGSYLFNGTSYNTTGTYSKTLMNAVGCDSIVTLNLTVNVPTTSTTNASICQGSSYTFNGSTYNVAGTYSKTLINAVGCDSIATLNLTVNIPTSSTTSASICQGSSYTFNGSTYSTAGTYSKTLINAAGCDSIATLNLTVNVPTSSTTNASICQGSSYAFNGSTYNIAGTYSKTLINAVGCDSITTLNLTVNVPTSSTTNTSICQGGSYTFNGSIYNVAGTYTKTLMNAGGCDSITTLNLTVNVPTSSTTNASICQGGSYLFNGTSYNTTGTYTKTLINVAGCDSIATLNLTVNIPTASTINASICQGSSYLFNGTSYNTTGTYSKILINSAGCDSIATLNLTVNGPTSSTTNASICQGSSYTFNGSTYNVAGTYSKTLINSVGCDSIATLNLTVNIPTTSTTNASICRGSSYLFNGTSYNTTGTYYTKTLINAVGCDSIATLNLRVNVPTSSTTNASICQGSSYTFNGSTYNVAGTYSKTLINAAGCDSIATLNLTVKSSSTSSTSVSICQGEKYSFNGSTCIVTGTYVAYLTNSVGCDSIATLHLTVNMPTSSTIESSISEEDIKMFGGYKFNGTVYHQVGTYTIKLVNATGCDSITTLVLKARAQTTQATKVTVCSSELPYLWNGTSYNVTGIFTKTLKNSLGVDSIATLDMTVLNSTSSVTKATVCSGNTYYFNGSSYSKAGAYVAKLNNSAGCDSIATLELAVDTVYNTSQTVQLFTGEKFTVNGHVYDQPGTYTDVVTSANNCESTTITQITMVDLPNAFTPNGDGVNDEFMKDWHVQIYNRNGILLFEGNDGWDGKYNGKPVTKDTYFFILYYLNDSKTKSKEGYVMLIR